MELEWDEIKHAVYALGIGLLIRWIWEASDHRKRLQDETKTARNNNDSTIQAIRAMPRAAFARFEETLPDDNHSATSRTLEVMRALVHKSAGDEELRAVAARLVAPCRGHDFLCEIKHVFDYVKNSITYRKDPIEVERVQDARRTIEFQSGDCDDKCVLLASLLAALGHRSRFVVVGFTTKQFSHVYLEVLYQGSWIPLDPTNEQAKVGWEAKGKIRQSYAIWN